MRHGKKFNHLSRKAGHRKALLSNMASQLIMHKRIKTTVAKAKALRKFVEPIISRSKEDTTHSRRMTFRYLQSKDAVKELFGEVAGKVADRPGGYTRVIRTGVRPGDAAEMAIIELVDFNDVYVKDAPKKGKTRRSRRGSGKGAAAAAATGAAVTVAQAKAQTEEALENAGGKAKSDEEE